MRPYLIKAKLMRPSNMKRFPIPGLGLVTNSNSELLSEIMNHFDNWYESLDGDQPDANKAFIYMGQQNTER
jgi:hypothetical protein